MALLPEVQGAGYRCTAPDVFLDLLDHDDNVGRHRIHRGQNPGRGLVRLRRRNADIRQLQAARMQEHRGVPAACTIGNRCVQW